MDFVGLPLPPLAAPISRLFFVIDFAGVFVAGVGGAFIAKRDERYQFDFVGVMGLALISALGGGVARDVLIGHGPPLAFRNVSYLFVALAGGLVGLWTPAPGARTQRLMLVVDALGLGFFAVAGSERALAAGLSVLPCILLGITTAVGGGSLRDVFSGRTPRVFERGEPYAIAAAIASVVYLAATHVRGGGVLATTLGVVTGFVVRIAAVRFRWRTSRVRESDPNA
jgi:uncharacterized membrane protein YeiH